jgi:integrase
MAEPNLHQPAASLLSKTSQSAFAFSDQTGFFTASRECAVRASTGPRGGENETSRNHHEKGKRWYIVYRTPTGKQKWQGGFDTKGEAQTRLTEVLGLIQKGDYAEPSEMTLGEFADQWLKGRVNVKGSTSGEYESYLKAHVRPELGSLKLKEISHHHIQDFIAQLTRKDNRRGGALSPNTVLKVIVMLKTLFKAAVRNGLLRKNPSSDLEVPKAVKAKIQPPSKQDVLAILQQAPTEYQPLFLLDAVTGLRRGEILALKWQDIDWMNQEVVIERAVRKVRFNDGVHKFAWGLGPTKGGRSRRVGIPPVVMQALRILRSAAGQTEADQFIFPRAGTFMDPEYFSKWIALPLVRKATEGRVKRFHDLRHFFASVLIESGESPIK